MKILVWDGQSQATEDFLEVAQKYADIDLFEDPMDLAASAASGDVIMFDLDANQKLVEKTLKKIRKSSVDTAVVLITNNLAAKEMAKHQKSKQGADIYLRSPVDEKHFINMLSPFVGEMELIEKFEDEQVRSIISDHLPSESAPKSAQTQTTNSELDEAFRKAMGDSGESARVLEEIKEQEIKEQEVNEIHLDEIDLDGNEEDLMELGGDEGPSLEELDMSENHSNELDDLGLDLSDANSTETDSTENDLGAGEELSLDSLTDETANEMSLDEGALELSGDEAGELSLGDDGPETFDLGADSDGLSLDDSSDVPLEIGEDTQAKELAAQDGLDLDMNLEADISGDDISLDNKDDELHYDDDNSKMFDLEAAEEKISPDEGLKNAKAAEDLDLGDLDLDEESAPSLEDELNLSGDEEVMNDAELFGTPLEEEVSPDASIEAEMELSADSLPDSPNLAPQAKANSEMSQHALEQLAQIDEIMKRDASQIRKGLKPDETREIDLNELQNGPSAPAPAESCEDGPDSEDLVAQLHAELEEEDYDPTAGIDENSNLEGPFTSTPEVTSTAIKTSTSINEGALPARETTVDPDAEKTIREQKTALMMHEEELIRLGATIKNLREDREELSRQIEVMREKNDSEKRDYQGLRAQLDEKRIELEVSRKRAAKQAEEMRYRIELSEDRARALEEKAKRLELENEKLRGKANIDVTRIRARERELENKLELLKADTETQIRNRDLKILELKRKVDTLEFDIESIQHKEQKTVDSNYAMEERMDRVINTLRRAIGELESEDAPVRNLEALKKNLDI